MKVTPLSGPNMGSAEVGQGSVVSADAKERAKKVFLGQSTHEITQSDTPTDPNTLAKALNIKKIKMRTQASPERYLEEQTQAELPEEINQESATTDVNETNESEVTRPISPQFAALAKQRRELQVMKQEIAKEKQALAEAKALPESAIDLAKLKSRPLEALKQAGVSYEELTNAILAEQSGVNPDLQALQAKVDALEKGIDTKLSERDAQAEKQVLAEIQREADHLVTQDPEFEMIRGTNSQKKVTELIHRIWKDSGEVLDVTEAAKLIENQLVEDSLKVASISKIRSRLTPEQQAQATQAPQRQGIKTLTNRDAATRPMSAKARAMAAFNGTLKR